MANCAKCGVVLAAGATFCGSCGTPVGAAVGNLPDGGAPAPGAGAASSSQSNVLALVAYLTLGIAGIIFIIGEQYKGDKFLRFHSFQSVFFSIANIALWIVLSILGSILTAVTLGFGALLLIPLFGLVGLAIFAYWIYIMYKAYSNERYMIPVVGAFAAKQAG